MVTDSFITPDGIKIHTVHWQPEQSNDRVIILVHGMGEHSGRYAHVAQALTDAGYDVYALDHYGHGLSGGNRMDVPTNNRFITDLKQYYDRVRTSHPDSDIYMLGHSMGSVITLHFLLIYPNLVKAVIVTGTATDVVSNAPPIVRGIANILNSFSRRMPISPYGGLDVLTRDPEIIKQTENDPLFHKGWTTTSVAKYIVDNGEMIQERASELTLPILFMHGEADELTPISGSQIMYERVSSEDKTLKTYPEMRHEILNEIGRGEVIETIIEWLNQH